MYWRVNSYGYPNPFGSDRAISAWNILLSFTNHNTFDELKIAWENGDYDKRMGTSAVGSWKSNFEELGLLFVETRKSIINITPIGKHLIKAGIEKNQEDFFKAGVLSLLRFPLKGAPPPRLNRGTEFKTSDVLPYWLLFAAMLELEDKLFRPEIDFIISRIFKLSEVPEAVENIKKLRKGELDYQSLKKSKIINDSGTFYNSINQVINHASMNYLIWNKETTTYPHTNEDTTVYSFVSDKKDYIIQQMGGQAGSFECEEQPSFLLRIPEAPAITTELDYFEYLGMDQVTIGEVVKDPLVKLFNGTDYTLMVKDVNYSYVGAREISGSISQLCRLFIGQDLVLSHDTEKWLYKVKKKVRNADGTISVILRTGKPILDANIIKNLFDNGES